MSIAFLRRTDGAARLLSCRMFSSTICKHVTEPPAQRPRLPARGMRPAREAPVYGAALDAAIENAWDATCNPGGVVSLGMAENQGGESRMRERMGQIDLGSPATSPDAVFSYHDEGQGWAPLREALARVLEELVFRTRGAPIDPRRLVVSNGLTSTLTMLAQAVSDGGPEGGKVMYVVPRYSGFRYQIAGNAGVETVAVGAGAGPGHLPTAAELDVALDAEPRVAALVLCNPDNPTGRVPSWLELQEVADWAQRRGVWLISDEIYGGGTFQEGAHNSLWDRADATLWGFSKDVGWGGARLGVAYISLDDGSGAQNALLEALQSRNLLHLIAGPADVVFTELLRDLDWFRSHMQACTAEMKASADLAMGELRKLGVPFTQPDSGVFLWVDFSELGVESLQLFETLLNEHKVLLTPGCAFYDNSADGRRRTDVYHMRLCYGACGGREALKVGLRRIGDFVFAKRAARHSTHIE